MTDMLSEYRKHREQGHTHWAACLALSRRFGFDKHTVHRVINRAEHAEAQAGEPRFHMEHTRRHPAVRVSLPTLIQAA